MSEGMIKWNVQQEKHYLAQLICDEASNVECGQFKHVILSRLLIATAQPPNTVGQIIEDFIVPKDQCWLVTYAGVRSDGAAADFPAANDDLRSDSDLSPVAASTQLAQWQVNGAAKTPICPRTALLNAPYLLVFGPGERVQLLINSGIAAERVVLNTRINSYLVPSRIGSIFTAHQTIFMVQLAAGGGAAVVIVGSFRVWDVSNPASPFQISQTDGGGQIGSGVAALLVGTNVWTVDTGIRFSIISVSDQSAPVMLGQLVLNVAADTNNSGLALDGTNAFVIAHRDFTLAGQGKLFAVNAAVPATPALTHAYSTALDFAIAQQDPQAIVSHLHKMYILNSDSNPAPALPSRFGVYDVTDPAAVAQQGVLSFGVPAFSTSVDLAIAFPIVYALFGSNGTSTAGRFLAIDVTDPANPVVVSTTVIGVGADRPRKLFLSGTTLYVGSDLKIFTYDVAVPAAPVLVGSPLSLSPDISRPLTSFFIRSGLAYLGQAGDGETIAHFSIFDLVTGFKSQQPLIGAFTQAAIISL